MKSPGEHRCTTDQRVFIVKTFYKTENKSETCRRFRERFNQPLKRDTVAGLINRFEVTGSVDDLPRPGRPRTITTEANKQIVEESFSRNPKKSTRKTAQELGISKRSVRRMLGELGLKQEAVGQASSSDSSNPTKDQASPKDTECTMGFVGIPLI